MFTFTQGITKKQLVNNLKKHQGADRFIQGTYGKYDGNTFIGGCAVSCTLVDFGAKTNDHQAYEDLFGIPRIIAKLEDGIFEGLNSVDKNWWPVAFAEAVPESKDLSLVWSKFAVWMLEDVKQYARKNGVKAIDRIIELYNKQILGEKVDRELWIGARKAATTIATTDATTIAATYAADAATIATTYVDNPSYADAATYAADAANYAANYAADAATYAANYVDNPSYVDAVRQNKRKQQAEKLIEILQSIKEYDL